MYSNFNWEDIEITDWKGLISFLEAFNKAYPDYWVFAQDSANALNPITNMIDMEHKSLSFELWDNIKLISYWYSIDVAFLELIAPYLEGEVHWTFENDDEGGYVSFRNKECIITTGQMRWEDSTPKELIRFDKEKQTGEQEAYNRLVKDFLIPNKL